VQLFGLLQMSFHFSAKHVTLGFVSYFPGTDVGFETGTYTCIYAYHHLDLALYGNPLAFFALVHIERILKLHFITANLKC
jgi:hypothetical protein